MLENIEVPLAYNGGMTKGDHARTAELSKLVGLDDRVVHRPTELSGGQQQRAGIARSLINQPEFILADEATGNLDTATTNEILDMFDDLNDKGTTIVMVTHEEEVAQHARRIVRLRDGMIESDERVREPSAGCREDHMTSRSRSAFAVATATSRSACGAEDAVHASVAIDADSARASLSVLPV